MSGAAIRVGLVGGGAVAHALSAALGSTQESRVKVWARRAAASASVAALSPQNVEAVEQLRDLSSCEVLLVAVSDSALEEVAALLRGAFDGLDSAERVILHTNGARTGADALSALGAAAAAVGSLHPLVAVAADAAPSSRVFAGRPFLVEASSEAAAELGRRLVRAVGGFEVQLPDARTPEEASRHKARYHALATMVATGVVTLVDRAAESMTRAGSSQDSATRAAFRRAYGALAESAVQNVLRDAGARVLTGAIARDDEALVEQHRVVLDDDPSAPLYRAVEEAARSMLQDDENPKP